MPPSYHRPSRYRRSVPAERFVYFGHPGREAIRVRDVEAVKIGLADDPFVRLHELRSRLIFAVRCEADFAPQLERALHEEFEDARVVNTPCGWMGHRLEGREWFLVDERLRYLIGASLNLGYWAWDRRPLVVPEGLVR